MKNGRRISSLISAILVALATGTLFGQTTGDSTKYTSWWLPDQASTVAADVDNLFYIILWITSIVFVLVFALLIAFMIKYRAKEGGKAIHSHGNNRLEIAWTITPALILVFLAILSQNVWSDMKGVVPNEEESLVVMVSPRQFQWDIRYAGADGEFNTPDDITTINQMYIPVNKTVLVKMTAQDVIHSFFVPEFRIKQDALPGMETKIWFTATKTGMHEIACAELCGLGHYRMRGFMNIYDQAGFDEWYQTQMAEKDAQLNPPPVETTEAAGSEAEADSEGAAESAPSGSTDAADTTSGEGTTAN